MLKLTGEHELHVNPLGFIDKWSLDNSINADCPIYLVFFKDHSQVDPTCPHLDTSRLVDNLTFDCDEQSLSYTKTIGNILIVSSVRMFDQFLHWKITIQGKYVADFRFGIVYPVQKEVRISSNNQQIETPISNYFHMLTRSFRDQTILDVPLITAEQDKHISFFCSLNNSIQFFHNTDGSNVRITYSTSITNCFEIFILSHETLQEGKQALLERYKESAPILNRWVQPLEQIKSKYKTKIRYYHNSGECESHGKKYTYQTPSDLEMEKYCILFNQEINKYPVDIFKQLQISGILLVADMKAQYLNQVYDVHGAIFYDQLILDANHPNAWVVHHEMFHCIENQIVYESWPEGNESLFEQRLAIDDNHWPDSEPEVEFRCNLFSWLMIDKKEVDRLCLSNPILNDQVNIIVEKTRKFVELSAEPLHDDTRLIYFVNGSQMQTMPFGQLGYDRFFFSSPESELVDNELFDSGG